MLPTYLNKTATLVFDICLDKSSRPKVPHNAIQKYIIDHSFDMFIDQSTKMAKNAGKIKRIHKGITLLILRKFALLNIYPEMKNEKAITVCGSNCDGIFIWGKQSSIIASNVAKIIDSITPPHQSYIVEFFILIQEINIY